MLLLLFQTRLIAQLVQKKNQITRSSVARGGGVYSPPPPIGMSTKMQDEKNTTFLALLFYAL